MMSENYVALDLETTGLNPNRDRILEIGAVKVIGGEITDTYETFVDCQMRIPDKVKELTGIDDSMMKNAESTEAAVRMLVDFCDGLPLLGHNIIFDYSFVKRQAVNYKLSFEKKGIDTLKIARQCLDDVPSKSLTSLCCHFGIGQERHHRALDDALSSSELYKLLANEYARAIPRAFIPQELIFQVKKQSPITNSQKVYLIDLVKYHRIELDVTIESMTRNDASRLIDKIILEYGRIKR